MKNFLFLLLLIASPFVNFAQSTGDTTVVEVLNYQTPTRDTIAHFPAASGKSYEKVIMRYAMRCKDAKVSPPIQGRTNEGCGEWDYSCNTYITDSSRVDSLLRTIDQYLSFPANASGLYSTTPTWNAYATIHKSANIQAIITEDTAQIGSGNLSDSLTINTKSTGGKTYILLDSTELSNAGLIAGDIDGLNIENLGGSSTLYNLKIKLKNSSLDHLSSPKSSDFSAMSEVFFSHATASAGLNRIPFYTAFNWDGSSNILIEISYKTKADDNPLKLASHTTSSIMNLSSSDDGFAKLAPNNYVEANHYFGISGNNERTVEAWVKSAGADQDILSWGADRLGEKFRFRFNNNGALRLEINGGYIIGTTLINDNKWHHVALTFKGSTINDVKLFVDGVEESIASSLSIPINTAVSQKLQISRGFHGRYLDGSIDDVRIWSKALSDSTIANWTHRNIDSTHANFDDLELNYVFNAISSEVKDLSSHQRNGNFKQARTIERPLADEHFKGFSAMSMRPNIGLFQGDYTMTVVNDTILDTVYNAPYHVSENSIFPKTNTFRSDSIGFTSFTYWPITSQIISLRGRVDSTLTSKDTLRLSDSKLEYYNRYPSNIEIMSFVTPYGINLDLGVDGKAWYFDVTDFLPILIGDKRFFLSRGGQNQEEMDIQFYFIEGTPPRDVKDIRQIWRVDSRSYTQIIDNEYFEPVDFKLDTSASAYKIRSVITGHGQQGEFIPRNHFININGGLSEFNWQVWMECSENPVFPQGGTWIYDRAGWCPGMASMVEENDITDLVGSSSSVEIDYGVSAASGTSNYIVNNQLVTYGAPNHNLDARITAIINPTNDIEYGRFNPVCNEIQIKVQNAGKNPITSIEFDYWINNGNKESFTWNDSINFLEEAVVSLPANNHLYSQAKSTDNNFHVEIKKVNGASDDYVHNDKMSSSFSITDIFPTDFHIEFRTNSRGNESSYEVRNDTGGIIFQRSSMASNYIYKDTFKLGSGCYTINVFDSDDDGLSFFANTDGNGSINVRELGGRRPFLVFQPNFGGGFSHSFTIPYQVGLQEVNMGSSISLFPNPSSEIITIETTGLEQSNWEVYNNLGQKMADGNTNQQHYSTFKLNISSYRDGIYFIRFTTSTGDVEVKHFVVNH